jgi:hypothetical protein
MQTQFSMSPDIRLTIEGCSGAFAARAQLSLRLRAFPHIPGLPDAEVPKKFGGLIIESSPRSTTTLTVKSDQAKREQRA